LFIFLLWRPDEQVFEMKARLALAAVIFASAGAQASEAQARAQPPLRNPALLNIGFVCRWETRCIRTQEKAMFRTLRHMRKYPPAAWKVQMCNRNSARNGTRKDWVGFENCLRNTELRAAKSRKRRLT
jgi:hypothetical protein